MRIRAIPALALALALSACAATDYVKQNGNQGYDEQEIRPGIWRVMFFGNGHTTLETVQTYWLYRCVELTQERGFDGFEIVSGVTLTDLDWTAPITVSGGAKTVYVPTYVYTGPSAPVVSPSIVAEIKLVHKPIQQIPNKIYDAQTLKNQLEPHVKGKKCAKGNVCPYVHQYLFPDAPTNAPVG